jgi:RNA polymerase sigma factor (sigma-70 family)
MPGSAHARIVGATSGRPPPGFAREIAEREVARLEITELVRRSGSGDVLAYERLFGLVQPQITRYARAQGKRLHLEQRLVEEVVDESLGTVHLNLRHLRDPRKLTGWVHRIVWNALLRAGDEQRRVALFTDPAKVLEQIERGEPSARTVELDALFELWELLEEIARLPEGQRNVLVLRELVELDVEQTSRMLGVSPGTVKSQLHDALRNLRSQLAEHGYAGGS